MGNFQIKINACTVLGEDQNHYVPTQYKRASKHNIFFIVADFYFDSLQYTMTFCIVLAHQELL
jgi:hypothetical protein